MSNFKSSRHNDSLSALAWKEIEGICVRFEKAWNRDESPRLEDYLVSDWPAEKKRLLFRELLMVELDRLRNTGAKITDDDYHRRFTDYKSTVDQAFTVCTAEDPNGTVDYSKKNRDLSPSSNIGPYKLLQLIGEGGMGTVWMAEQEQPVRRRVALKLVKEGIGSKEVLARFEAERQALALMNHQNIAKVLDAGVTGDGQPFFAMELVQGIPITEYCNKNRLSPEDRLELFVPICHAIQHAHQKGIIHRDIKPSNVLVTLYDGKAVPKVIDFGLAKALQTQFKLTDKTIFTEFGKVMGTLNYMSPEQAEMNALDVDTRTDIYSLGVMLYELLTGSTPLEKETARQMAFLSVLKTIREEEPPRPSQRLSDSGDSIQGISEQRKIEPRQLMQILRGDLDWIVMKSLEKDRTRRYSTAHDLAEDVERYIDGAPVEARPPSTTYRLGKFARKNSVLVSAIAAVSFSMLLGLAATTWFGFKANSARKVAESESLRADEKANEARRKAAEALSERDRADAEAEKANVALAQLTLERDRYQEWLAKVSEQMRLLASDQGASIVFILDASVSMKRQIRADDGPPLSRLDIAKRVLGTFLTTFNSKNVNVGLVVYGHRAGQMTNGEIIGPEGLHPGEDVEFIHRLSKISEPMIQEIMQKLSKVRPRGHSPIYYAIRRSCEELADVRGRKMIVLLADVENVQSPDTPPSAFTTLADVKRAISRSRVERLSVISLVASDSSWDELRDLVVSTKGNFLMPDENDFPSFEARLTVQLAKSLGIDVSPPDITLVEISREFDNIAEIEVTVHASDSESGVLSVEIGGKRSPEHWDLCVQDGDVWKARLQLPYDADGIRTRATNFVGLTTVFAGDSDKNGGR